MWTRLRHRLASAGAAIVCLTWFVGAVTIAAGPLGVEPARHNLWVVMLIFIAPLPFLMVWEEVAHRVKNGRQPQGRHTRES